MPATAAQVFGPVTVSVNFGATGEKTLLTMNTTLPPGGKNVIIAVFMPSSGDVGGNASRLRIKKGTTVISEMRLSHSFNQGGNRSKPAMFLAVDDSPVGNDSYTFTINIITAGVSSTTVHVQGLVIKTDDAVIAHNPTAVDLGTTPTTIVSLTTNFPAGSTAVALAFIYSERSDGSSGKATIPAGAAQIVLNNVVVSSNQHAITSWSAGQLALVNLAWLGTVSSSTQTWEVRAYRDAISQRAYAILVVFTVNAGAFLDTASVALAQNVQTTVGNLSTSLMGDVVVIALASAENTNASNVIAFLANGGVALQLNNSATGQITNLIDWWIEHVSYLNAGILPLLRIDTNVTNPSYQLKMQANVAGINAEAKIVAFSTVIIEYKNVTDSIGFVDVPYVSSMITVTDSVGFTDSPRSDAEIYASDMIQFTDEVQSPRQVFVTDSVSFTDAVGPNEIRVSDSVSFAELAGLYAQVSTSDSVSFAEAVEAGEAVRFFTDTISFSETVTVQKLLQRVGGAVRVRTARRLLASRRTYPLKEEGGP